MVAPTRFGITLPSSGSVPSAFWEILNWGAIDRILWMGVMFLVTWCVAIWVLPVCCMHSHTACCLCSHTACCACVLSVQSHCVLCLCVVCAVTRRVVPCVVCAVTLRVVPVYCLCSHTACCACVLSVQSHWVFCLCIVYAVALQVLPVLTFQSSAPAYRHCFVRFSKQSAIQTLHSDPQCLRFVHSTTTVH
jgi:hypothetical protein